VRERSGTYLSDDKRVSMHGFDATGFQKVLCEVSEKLGCDIVSDPHVLLLEVDDEPFRFMFGW